MQFNVTASPRNGIIQGIEKTTKLGLGTISGNSAPDYYLDQVLVLVNNWNNYCNHIIQRVSGEKQHDDINHPYNDDTSYREREGSGAVFGEAEFGDAFGGSKSFPIKTGSFSDNQQDIYLNSEIKTVRRFEIHDANDDADEGWSDIAFQHEKDRVADRFGFNSGTPSSYWQSGRSLVMDIPVDTDKIDKYRITYDRYAHPFVIDDTTAEPGFSKDFHPILVYGPSMELSNKPDVISKCEKMLFGASPDFPGLIKMMKQHYARTAHEFIPQVGRKAPSGGSWK